MLSAHLSPVANQSPVADQAPVADLLPHSGPMVLLDSITHWDTENIQCLTQSHLQPDNPLRDAGVLSVFAGIEYAAQAMAAHARLLGSAAADTPPQKGFLAVASKLVAGVDVLDGSTAAMQVDAHRLAHNAGSSLYSFSLTAGGKVLLTGQLTAVMVSEPSAGL